MWLRTGRAPSTTKVPGSLFYNDCSDEVADWAIARLGPQRIETLSQAPGPRRGVSKPSTYAVCTADNIVHPGLQRVLARRADHVVEWPTGHSPFLSRPELVADLLASQVVPGAPHRGALESPIGRTTSGLSSTAAPPRHFA